VCLSPLSQFFCNVEQPPDIYAVIQLQGWCSVRELVPPMQVRCGTHAARAAYGRVCVRVARGCAAVAPLHASSWCDQHSDHSCSRLPG
jgi:hypothetical protein